MAFSFGFTGDDIEHDETTKPTLQQNPKTAADYGAFPVAGKPQLPPAHHALDTLLAQLPSKIAFSHLEISLDNGETPMRIPRRELWDVRVQLMAEDDGRAALDGLGDHDVKTGVYEGGFKSWESSVDLVKTLAATRTSWSSPEKNPLRIIELGCGTALPSIAMFQWAMQASAQEGCQYSFVLADYNPAVLQLVTLPNLILSWAMLERTRVPAVEDAFTSDEELEITPEVLQAFQSSLTERGISVLFLSGAWSRPLVDMVYDGHPAESVAPMSTLILGAETIYSPFALASFTEILFCILEKEKNYSPPRDGAAYIAAKRLYFGVGGSLDDFVEGARSRGAVVDTLREESEGVRRGVVRCTLAETEGLSSS